MTTSNTQTSMPEQSLSSSSKAETHCHVSTEKPISDLESQLRSMVLENKSPPQGISSQVQAPSQLKVPLRESPSIAPSQVLPKKLASSQAGQGNRQHPSSNRPSSSSSQNLPSSKATQVNMQSQRLPRSQETKVSLSQNVAQQGQQNNLQARQTNRPKNPTQSQSRSRTQSQDAPDQGNQTFQPTHQTNQLNPRNTVQQNPQNFRHQQSTFSNQFCQGQQSQQGQHFQQGVRARNQMTVPRNQVSSSNMSHSRPAPQNRQLFIAGLNRPPSSFYNHDHPQTPAFECPTDAQVAFLKQLASIEIPKAEMTIEELDEKEALRLKLQELCRDAIFNYEITRVKDFKKNSVGLKCFGSLSSGFATKSSDMDLALMSPHSTPDTSSVESEIPRLLEKVLLESGYGARLITKTRVPIIKFCEKPTPELAEALLQERKKCEDQRDFLLRLAADKAEALKNQGTEEISNGLSKIPEVEGNNVGSDRSANEATNGDQITRSDEELVFLFKLAIEEGWYQPGERQIIHEFVKAVENNDSAIDDSALDKARTALSSLTDVLSKYRPPPEKHLNFPKTGVGIQCDINFSNPLALHNTRLLRCYALCDSRVRQMVLFVKAWAKRRKINSPYHGTLSSYGYVLMVLHYLANVVDPPIIPNLQTTRRAWQDTSPENAILVDGYNVRFWRSEKQIRDLARRKMLTSNTQDGMGILICGFFHYYAHQNKFSPAGGFSWTREVISLRTHGGLLQKNTKDWVGAKTVIESAGPGQEPREIRHRYLLAIEDPFELQHNIARTVIHQGIVSIRDEFRRAISIIQSVGQVGAVVEDLFAEGQEMISQPRRAFGPLPRVDQPDANGKETRPSLVLNENGKSVGGGKPIVVEKDLAKNRSSQNQDLQSTAVEILAESGVETNGSVGTKKQNGSKYSNRRVPSGRSGPTPSQASSNHSLSRQLSPTSARDCQKRSRQSSAAPEPNPLVPISQVQSSETS